MSFDSLLVRAVTLHTAGTTVDRYQNTIPDWDTATTTIVDGWFESDPVFAGDSELLDHRNGEVTEAVLFLPAGTSVTASMRVTIVGEADMFEVDGPPNHVWSPAGEHHIEVRLKRVTG